MPNGNVGKFVRDRSPLYEKFEDFAKLYVHLGLKPQTLRALYDKARRDKIYVSEIYQVNIDKEPEHGFTGMKVWHLSIKLRTKEPVMDWRDLQAIKNQLCGEHVEAIQLFPDERRVVDTSNQYHLFAFMPGKDGKTARIPVGWTSRMVSDNNPEERLHVPGAVQRPLPQG